VKATKSEAGPAYFFLFNQGVCHRDATWGLAVHGEDEFLVDSVIVKKSLVTTFTA
jgi:hypothetical protein